MQLLFSRNGLAFSELKPTTRQSSCSWSEMNFMMSWTAWDTVIRLMAASLLSCSVTCRCWCKLDIIMSMTAVSDRPIFNGCGGHLGVEKLGPNGQRSAPGQRCTHKYTDQTMPRSEPSTHSRRSADCGTLGEIKDERSRRNRRVAASARDLQWQCVAE